jgi:hypothetical protein
MDLATTTSKGTGVHRPRAGMALIAALGLGGLVATGAYAQRAGVFSMSDAGLSRSAAARAQLAGALAATPAARVTGHHRLLVWHAPRIPHVRVRPNVVTPPPRVVTVAAPAAPQQQVAATAPAPAPAPAPPASSGGDDGGDGSGGGE